MLFDLKGRRRRFVQVTYLTLAVLMGGGLVLFGIGGEVSGGLVDAFSDRSTGGSSSDDVYEKRIERAQTRLRANPRDDVALRELVRAHYQLAGLEAGQSTTFPPEAKDDLQRAAAAWERYLTTDPKQVDESLAQLMLQAYGQGGLNQPKKAVQTAEILAEDSESPQDYIIIAQLASLAGDSRKADLAGQKAIDLAPKEDKELVEQQVEQAKAASAIQQIQSQQGGGG